MLLCLTSEVGSVFLMLIKSLSLSRLSLPTFLHTSHLSFKIHIIYTMNGHFKVMAFQKARMATTNKPLFLLFFFIITLLLSAQLLQGIETEEGWVVSQSSDQTQKQQQSLKGWRKRMMIGSTAPTCTYNECRGCKHKCIAEQVPVEGNDPLNSPYHYRCICHR